MDRQDYISLILYYGRGKLFHSMQKTALDGLAKYPAQVEFRLFNGIALALGSRVQEAIRELNPLKNEPELGLAAVLALNYAHRRCNVIDKDALASLELKLKSERRQLSASSAYYAAVFLYLTDKVDKARDYADKALKQDDSLEAAIVLKAWTELTPQKRLNRNALNAFEQVLMRGKNIDAALGQVKYYQLLSEYDNAIAVLNKLSVRLPELNIPLIEKMETQLCAWDWEHAYETAMRIVNLEPSNIAALRIKALILLCREANVSAAATTLQQLLLAAERVELGNHGIILHICQLFARICSRNDDILKITRRHMEKICSLQPGSVEFLTELGYQQLLGDNMREAIKCFRAVTKVDNNYFLALCGLTFCQVLEQGVTAQARQQIEFLGDVEGIERNPMLLFLLAKITENEERAIGLLIDAAELHFQKLQQYAFGAVYLQQLHPDFLLQLTADLLSHSPLQVQLQQGLSVAKDSAQMYLKHCLRILEVVLKACPCHLHALYMKAKIEFICGELSLATASLNRILGSVDGTCTAAYLLLAQIQLQQKLYAKALQSLEIALSHDFGVRDNAMYRLLLGSVQKHMQQYAEAQKSLQAALQLVGSDVAETTTIARKPTSSYAAFSQFTNDDKVTLYLELVDVYSRSEEQSDTFEGERLLQLALDEFGNTPQEGRLVVAHAELLQKQGNSGKAIELLSAIQPGQAYYIQAKTQLAYMHLHERKDRVAFAKCFKELVENCPETASYLMLGEAYMSIQEPDLAVAAFEQALNMNPNDALLASKLGRAYVKTHQYTAAIKYYHAALKNPDHSGLKLDLAELYLKLKQFQNAADVLTDNEDAAAGIKIDENDIGGMQLRTKQLLLLARIREKSGNISLSLQTLKEARDNQYRIQKRISVEQDGNQQEQQKMLSKICLLMAQQYVNLRENEQALSCFKECLKYTPSEIEILASLARLYMQINSMDLCRDVCMQILHIDSNNDAASVMMADLSFRKMEFDNAAYHFSQLLISQHCYWTALARLIEVMRRSGTLSEIMPFFQRAEQALTLTEAAQSPGLNYCKGLHEWYSGNPNGALRHFNAARRDYEWGQQAIFNMIDICINPDGDLPSLSDALDGGNDSGEFSESRLIALRTAERLLKELRPQPGGMDNEALNHRMLHNFLQLAAKQKFQTESALQDFTELATKEQYQNMVGPILGMASALVQLKQTQRAKNHLKRIARLPWNFEEAEYLERSWLLLADIYMHANKLDVAEGYVDRVLEHNRSCSKAYEFAGFIAEKGQSYRDAAKCYQSAWISGGRSKPHIGYKLAFNYMKIKQYANAVDVCQQVIKTHPDYTIIKKDIMDKCRNYLRS